jgi:DegV family protein with EDD domain
LPEAWTRSHNVEVIPQVIIFGEETFLEQFEMDFETFMSRLQLGDTTPKTAAPPVPAAAEALRRQLEMADTVICIHPSTEVSGTVRTVETAKEENFPSADVRILDTRVVAASLASMVIKAVQWAEAGVDADEIMSRLRGMIPRARTYFLVDTLEYLRKGGRIGNAASLLGSALRIKPILHMVDGTIDVLEKVRTQHRAFERLQELVIAHCPPSEEALVSIMHADVPSRANSLRDSLQQELKVTEIPVYQLGASITTHAGPGTLGVSFFTQEE